MGLVAILRRAFTVNPQSVPLNPRENQVLEAAGVQEPVLRSYLVWRRSLMLFVVGSTLLSAGLATYRDFAEPEGRSPLLESLARRLSEQTSSVAPLLPTIEIRSAMEEAASDEDDETPTDTKEDEDSEEAKGTDSPSKTPLADGTAKPAASADGEGDEEDEPQTAFGQFTDFVQLLSLYALPVAALAAVLVWTRLRLSFGIMVAAFAFAFLTPLLIALCPWSWWGYEEPALSPQAQPIEFLESKLEGMFEAAAYLVTLLPTVLSLVPGVQRACVRVKMLMPQAMLPGWFLVVASPFYALFLLVVFVAVHQVDSHPLFFSGMLLFLLAPLVYAVRADLFTRPISTTEDERRIRSVQRVVGAMTGLAGALLTTYLATREVGGIRLLGFDPRTAVLVPLDVIEFALEVLSRSMFMTALGADLFLRMNLSAWRNTRDFAGSPESARYDRVMEELQRIP